AHVRVLERVLTALLDVDDLDHGPLLLRRLADGQRTHDGAGGSRGERRQIGLGKLVAHDRADPRLLVPVAVTRDERVHVGAVAKLHRKTVCECARALYIALGNVGADQDVARLALRTADALELDDVVAEARADRWADLSGAHREGSIRELAHHRAFAEVAEIATALARAGVITEPARKILEFRTAGRERVHGVGFHARAGQRRVRRRHRHDDLLEDHGRGALAQALAILGEVAHHLRLGDWRRTTRLLLA